ncbi:uncharacterized protein LOC131656046 [Vicia villosa]|uniref:uncharacterized protein LOC131656046 n=1 Tax=Vicia villosa TaxID=3911 RepID=UPI00273AE8A8|nr:uncharacterized protein LOC131656046 [Vicia villosa]
MYQELREEVEHMEWKKMFFSNYARPRAVFILWLTARGRLQTKDRLIRYGINVDANCVFCSAEETMDHLLFECSKTNEVWRNILTWVGYNRIPSTWTNESTWLITKTRKKGWRRDILKVAIAETVYAVWRMRNELIFNQHTMDDTITNTIKENVVLRCIGYKKIANHINRENLCIE